MSHSQATVTSSGGPRLTAGKRAGILSMRMDLRLCGTQTLLSCGLKSSIVLKSSSKLLLHFSTGATTTVWSHMRWYGDATSCHSCHTLTWNISEVAQHAHKASLQSTKGTTGEMPTTLILTTSSPSLVASSTGWTTLMDSDSDFI